MSPPSLLFTGFTSNCYYTVLDRLGGRTRASTFGVLLRRWPFLCFITYRGFLFPGFFIPLPPPFLFYFIFFKAFENQINQSTGENHLLNQLC